MLMVSAVLVETSRGKCAQKSNILTTAVFIFHTLIRLLPTGKGLIRRWLQKIRNSHHKGEQFSAVGFHLKYKQDRHFFIYFTDTRG